MADYETRAAKIGARLKVERKRAELSQAQILETLGYASTSTKTWRSWERGEALPDVQTFARMSDLFDCDVGYLLADYDERTHVSADVVASTGLSSGGVERLRVFAENPDIGANGYALELLSFLLESGQIIQMAGDAERVVSTQEQIDALRREIEKIPEHSIDDRSESAWTDGGKKTKLLDGITQLKNIQDGFIVRSTQHFANILEAFAKKGDKEHDKH
ncbi:MAG: helix-turn-helix domain-containing protein [Oscillospiraceae bacterium]|nr:helix-turn-helix domain-containing protein [Oscillospiraceae bacterium]